jgi:hypothetical protein
VTRKDLTLKRLAFELRNKNVEVDKYFKQLAEKIAPEYVSEY